MRKGAWILGAIAVIFIAAVLNCQELTQGPSFRDSEAHHKSNAGQTQQTVARSNRPPPSTFKRQPPPAEYKPDCSKREDSDLCAQRRMAAAAERQDLLNRIGLVLLFGTLGFTGWAAWSAKRAAVATGAAAMAAEASAAIANATLQTMQDTAERQLRAYISVTPHIEAHAGTTVPPSYKLVAINCGSTPAYEMRNWTDGAVAEYPLESFPINRRNKGNVTGTLAPGRDMYMNGAFEHPLSNEIAKRLLDGSMRIYVWGEITFRDAFRQPRYVRFRYMFGGDNVRTGAVTICDEGNEEN